MSRPRVIILPVGPFGINRAFSHDVTSTILVSQNKGHVAALVRPRMNGLLPFESTIEQTTETMPLSHKTITATAMIKCLLTGAATLLQNSETFGVPSQFRGSGTLFLCKYFLLFQRICMPGGLFFARFQVQRRQVYMQ